ncbi:MAG: hypothetical protein WBV59_05700 [Anaerolineae bacterium]
MFDSLLSQLAQGLTGDLPEPASALVAPDEWRTWLTTLFQGYVRQGFAPRHVDFWEWVWALEAGKRPAPFVAIWPRGGGKSTSAELAVVVMAARRARRYGLYVCETQDQADDHVQNVASLLESRQVELYYPRLAERAVSKYGSAKGWRRNRLRTASGFTVDAIGLDSAARGAKVDEHRPGFMILDDLDGELDSVPTVEKKITTLTKKLLPAGATDLAVLAVQNLVHGQSIFARLGDGRADFLADRTVSGPHPAIEGLTYEQRDGRYVITGGTATWAGQDLGRCQAIIADTGLTAFLSESQHEVTMQAGGMFSHLEFRHCVWDQVPDLVRVVVWVDPAVTSTDDSDSQGIQADGLAPDGTIYRLWSWEQRTTPQDSLQRAIRKAVELGARAVGVETDQGGDTWQSVYREAVLALKLPKTPPGFRSVKAGAGYGPKVHRAGQMLADYEQGRIVHVTGTHQVLERALFRFPKVKPFDLVDAAFWSWNDLRHPATMTTGQVEFYGNR